jgi:uncharacterized protein (DUF58 family)
MNDAIQGYSPFPLSFKKLNDYRITARRFVRSIQSGGHVNRRRGQSMEFLELKKYEPGDDYKHIDWRASARFGGPYNKIVRTYGFEEQFHLFVSIDNRTTMHLPDTMPKLLAATWLTTALAVIARFSGDRVFIHRLFGNSSKPQEIQKANALEQLSSRVWSMLDLADEDSCNALSLSAILPPASVWVIITDLYFNIATPQIIRAIRRAAARHCWIVLVELDSWPFEESLLADKNVIIDGPNTACKEAVFFESNTLEFIRGRIHKHRLDILQALQISGFDHTRWGLDNTLKPDIWFAEQFFADHVLKLIFEREQ